MSTNLLLVMLAIVPFLGCPFIQLAQLVVVQCGKVGHKQPQVAAECKYPLCCVLIDHFSQRILKCLLVNAKKK